MIKIQRRRNKPGILGPWCVRLLAFLFLTQSSWAQQITGKVSDAQQLPIAGVSVVVKGTAVGTITDVSGNYSLSLPKNIERPVLVFSFIGYETQTIPVQNRTSIQITLKETAESIDEVVVIGYGAVRKSDLTGSVSSVKVDEKDAAKNVGVDKLLQGRVPGVFVNTTSGAPGAMVDVRIRGTNSLGSGNDPLYVIDGIMIDATEDVKNPFSTGGQEQQNGLMGISPADIASIEVLKDASATAIYGSRGANGVVLITTKRGTTEKPTVQINTSVGVSMLAKTILMMDGVTYAKFREEYDGKIIGTPEEIAARSVNWQEEVTRPSLNQNYRISVSGQTKAKNSTNYFIALGHANTQGIVIGTGLENSDARLNLVQNLGSKFRITSQTSASFIKNNWMEGTEPGGSINSSMVRSMIQSIPLRGFNSESEDEMVDDMDIVSSPLAWINGYDDKSKEFRVLSSLNVDYLINKSLTFRVSAMGDYRNKTRMRWYSNLVNEGKKNNGKAGWSNMNSTFYTLEALLMYNYVFDRVHKLNGTIGVTYDQKKLENKYTSAQDFPNQTLGAMGIAGALKVNPFVLDYTKTQVFSTLARINYSYRDKYLVTLTGRYDGASRFAEGHKFGFFPSVALAWRANQEPFLKEVEWISNLKVRAGWGQVGKQTISPYQTLQKYSVGFAPGVGGYDVAYTPDNIPNTRLTWETTSQYNVGFDWGLFNNRLNIVFDAYYKVTDDLLQNISIPASSGYKKMAVNRGSIENKGFEFSVDGLILNTKDWNWNVNVNGSVNRNRIKSIGLPSQYFSYSIANAKGYLGNNISANVINSPANIFLEGRPVGMFYGLKADGIAQEPRYTSDGKPVMWNGQQIVGGMLNYVDVNDDGVIDMHDRVLLGDPNPDFVYGFSTTLSWKGLTLDVLFNGVLGRDIVNANLYMENFSVGGGTKNRRTDAYGYAWREGDPNGTNATTKYQSLTAPQPTEVGSWVVEDGSYLRLSNITLSYDIPMKKTSALKRLNVYVSGNNLFVWTKYSEYDPEVNSFSGNAGIIGVDWNSSPSVRSVLVGLNLTF